MELKTAIEILEYHQEWRLGKREDMIHEPKKLTEALNIVLNDVKKYRLADVSGMLPTDDEIINEAEGRYPVKTHNNPDSSPYVGAQKTFIHGVRWALAFVQGNYG